MNGPDYLGKGARLADGPSAPLADLAFAHELEAAAILWDGLGLADIAHLLALHEASVVPEADVCVLLDSLLELQARAFDPSELDPLVGDVYSNREKQLRLGAGDVTGHLPAGRARREATTISWQIACRDRLFDVGLALADFVDAATAVATAHATTLMPDYTYLQHAHPTSLGHYLLGHVAPFVRHLDRVGVAIDAVDKSPAGSGSTNGTSIPLDRRFLADLLGFGDLIVHTRDAMWAPDMVIDQIGLVVNVLTSVDRLAEELQIWATSEFDVVELADRHCRTSVVMPQKKNPYALSYLRGVARHRIPESTGIVATMLTPSGQPENRTFAYRWVPETLAECERSLRLAAEVLSDARFNTERLAELANDGFIGATEICDQLTLGHGVDNRSAHQLVGRAVRRALDSGRAALCADDLDLAAIELGVDLPTVTDQWIAEVTDPAGIVGGRITPGGAGMKSMAAMAGEAHRAADTHRRAWIERRSLWSPALLEAKARRLLSELKGDSDVG